MRLAVMWIHWSGSSDCGPTQNSVAVNFSICEVYIQAVRASPARDPLKLPVSGDIEDGPAVGHLCSAAQQYPDDIPVRYAISTLSIMEDTGLNSGRTICGYVRHVNALFRAKEAYSDDTRKQAHCSGRYPTILNRYNSEPHICKGPLIVNPWPIYLAMDFCCHPSAFSVRRHTRQQHRIDRCYVRGRCIKFCEHSEPVSLWLRAHHLGHRDGKLSS